MWEITVLSTEECHFRKNFLNRFQPGFTEESDL